ncbi:anaerobic ribonucleoside-triphosphate reductase-activating protein [Biostraticola tofi]|uniref:Anaerobic ribonucleoside-triphosphate reductase-activating protein n=1 Tax=Biostraticola tofi TaxID=466109 RepID=A0A4R3YK40_9GAMM|nr:anaerobic ribonucleoside-triphosphate reductase-activating protein [Biostraticola tofi]TCV92472.1 ribonucleoside-triphosphate reductase class III activase subunit [Biostraticola tofi]
MNFHQYYPIDVVNGPGTRCTLFVAGCVHQCPGCYNKSTWRIDSGKPFTVLQEDQIIADLQDTRIRRQGLSLSGGDPLHPQNLGAIEQLLGRVRAECAGKDVWIWTGYQLAELSGAQQRVIALADVLVDGKFVQDLRDPALIWRGSSNQVIHYLRSPVAQQA